MTMATEKVRPLIACCFLYNFSAPFLSLTGTLVSRYAYKEVEGTAWVHKEGSGLLGVGQQGWDWFVFNLDDGTKVAVNRYRHNQQMPYVFSISPLAQAVRFSTDWTGHFY